MSAIWYSYSKITHRAEAANDHPYSGFLRIVHEQPLEGSHLDPRIILDGRANQARALFRREQRLFRDVRRDGDDEPVDERKTALDQIGVTVRDRIEASGVHRDIRHRGRHVP
jgi:hypothetical protein